jgi:hypothetical protein
VNALAANPELLRNSRIQLRRGRLLAAAVICAAVSLSFVTVYRFSPRDNLKGLFVTIFPLQAIILVIGGSIYCLQSVQREKDQNTFDFQRITRLSPLQLALGKVLGAPALAYFGTLCLTPVALWAALAGGVSVSTLLQMYIVLALGAFTFHCLAVLVSMVLEKGTSAGAMFFFLWAIGMTAIDMSSGYQQGPLALHAIGPFWAYNLVDTGAAIFPPPAASPYYTGRAEDLFFGLHVPHSGVLIFLYATMAAWFLLALARNIKRDPSVYEIFRPIQAFALALYLNGIVLAFFRWVQGSYTQQPPDFYIGSWQFRPVTAQDAENAFLAFSLGIFLVLGLTLLRNRERSRRFLREVGASSADWLAAIWPAPYLILGTILSGAAVILMIRANAAPQADWSLGMGVVQVAFVGAWLARDFIYLQWMNLRRARRPLLTGILFLVVYYACVGVVLSTLNLFARDSSSIAAIFIPSAAFRLDASIWSAQQARWLVTLVLLLAQSVGFAWLQRRELKHLAAVKPATAPSTHVSTGVQPG